MDHPAVLSLWLLKDKDNKKDCNDTWLIETSWVRNMVPKYNNHFIKSLHNHTEKLLLRNNVI